MASSAPSCYSVSESTPLSAEATHLMLETESVLRMGFEDGTLTIRTEPGVWLRCLHPDSTTLRPHSTDDVIFVSRDTISFVVKDAKWRRVLNEHLDNNLHRIAQGCIIMIIMRDGLMGFTRFMPYDIRPARRGSMNLDEQQHTDAFDTPPDDDDVHDTGLLPLRQADPDFWDKFLEYHVGCCNLECDKCFDAPTEDRMRTRSCMACRAVSYCSKQCQRDDWKRHKAYCQWRRARSHTDQT